MKRIKKILGLMIFLSIVSNVQADMFLGEFVDHASDIPVTSEGALRKPASYTTAEFITYGKTGDQNHKGYLSQSTTLDKKSGLIVITVVPSSFLLHSNTSSKIPITAF